MRFRDGEKREKRDWRRVQGGKEGEGGLGIPSYEVET